VEEDRGRSAERLVTFTDAVVAIAVTLLALPLADIVREVAGAGGGLDEILDKGALALLGFAISFFVIARLWWAHHRIFEHVTRWDGPLVYLTIVWLFTVVLLAPVTALTDITLPGEDSRPLIIYIGVMTVSSALLTTLSWHVRRHPQLTDGHDDGSWPRLFSSAETTIAFAVALVIGAVFPYINYFALFLLAFTGQISRIVERRRERRLNIR
jgi:uncharacterized membrane protein